MNKEKCNYWIDCHKDAAFKINYKINTRLGCEGHTHLLCEDCQKNIGVNLPKASFDYKEEAI